jgi:hypothetical protein
MESAFSGNQHIPAAIKGSNEKRLENSVDINGRLEILEVSEAGPRLVQVGSDGRSANHAADPLPHPLRELVDEMPIMTHAAIGR